MKDGINAAKGALIRPVEDSKDLPHGVNSDVRKICDAGIPQGVRVKFNALRLNAPFYSRGGEYRSVDACVRLRDTN
jgi:hypothetical protein